GAYLESPEIAFPEKADVDANYVKLTDDYLGNISDAYLCLATHDEEMIRAAENSVVKHNVPSDKYEFQMLYGVRSDRQEELAQKYTMRVYVPFGEAWYPYFVRRLAERPANLWFFMKNFFG
ncbi:MAG: proline dehydrogenase family protein, partial [Aggregatilineales bacterium]